MKTLKAVLFFFVFVGYQNAFSQIPPLNGYLWWGDKASATNYMSSVCYEYNSLGCWIYVSMNSQASAAAAHYLNSTDLSAGYGPNGEGQINVMNFDMGPTVGWAGLVAYSNGIQCSYYPSFTYTGNCNNTTVRATDANLYVNRYHFDDQTSSYGPYNYDNYMLQVFLHELGHAFGLSHNDWDSGSVMKYAYPTGTSLRDYEIDWIDYTY